MTSTQSDILKSKWKNPRNIDLCAPFLYFIKVVSPTKKYRYVGKASSESRITEYCRNISRILAGQPRRPFIKKKLRAAKPREPQIPPCAFDTGDSRKKQMAY